MSEKIMLLADMFADACVSDAEAGYCAASAVELERLEAVIYKARAALSAAVSAQEAEISKLHEKLASLETSMPPVPEFLYVGSVQHLCELNDEWASKLPTRSNMPAIR